MGKIGEFGRSTRISFPFLWATADFYNVGLTDAADSPWADSTFLGRLLDRDEALAHPWCKEVFHLTDHITTDDPEAAAFLAGPARGGT